MSEEPKKSGLRQPKKGEPDAYDAVKGWLQVLRPHVRRTCRASGETPSFKFMVRAALVKAFEFALHTHRPGIGPSFATPTLRGICEDLIVLSFLEKFEDREEILDALSSHQMTDGSLRQDAFFAENRIWQPTYVFPDTVYEKTEAELVAIAKAHKWGKRLPTVKHMATESGNLTLYEYIYAATSRWVHFSCAQHYRTAWLFVPHGKERPTSTTEFALSTKHFARYYIDFNKFYSAYLLELLCRRFAGEFSDRDGVLEVLDSLRKNLNAIWRWPEMLTYEELNQDPPSDLVIAIARAKAERTGEGSAQFLPLAMAMVMKERAALQREAERRREAEHT